VQQNNFRLETTCPAAEAPATRPPGLTLFRRPEPARKTRQPDGDHDRADAGLDRPPGQWRQGRGAASVEWQVTGRTRFSGKVGGRTGRNAEPAVTATVGIAFRCALSQRMLMATGIAPTNGAKSEERCRRSGPVGELSSRLHCRAALHALASLDVPASHHGGRSRSRWTSPRLLL